MAYTTSHKKEFTENPMETLDDLRSKIDAIDDDILKRLEERTAIVEQVGHRKTQSGNGKSFIRPGREATMLRNLVHKTQGKFPKAAIAAIWRIIISSSLSVEQNMRIAAYRTPGEETCYWLAREYFGAFTPVEARYETEEILGIVERGDAAVGVLPMPWHDTDSNRWWLELRKTNLKIFARIPFVQNLEEELAGEAVAIANVLPEPTGDDVTLLCLEISSKTTDTAIANAMKNYGLDILKLCSAMEGDDVVLLAYVKGFYTGDSEVIQSLANLNDVQKATILGSYANPIVLG